MRVAVFCVRCGAERSYDTVRGFPKPGTAWCFRCAGDLFVPDRRRAPQWTGEWFVTTYDRNFLKSMRIAPGDVPIGATR